MFALLINMVLLDTDYAAVLFPFAVCGCISKLPLDSTLFVYL